eukprot:5397096-Prymnesium_polylepis.1
MDSAALDAAVSRLRTLTLGSRDWADVADELARLLRRYPDGLTDAIVRSTLQQALSTNKKKSDPPQQNSAYLPLD